MTFFMKMNCKDARPLTLWSGLFSSRPQNPINNICKSIKFRNLILINNLKHNYLDVRLNFYSDEPILSSINCK